MRDGVPRGFPEAWEIPAGPTEEDRELAHPGHHTKGAGIQRVSTSLLAIGARSTRVCVGTESLEECGEIENEQGLVQEDVDEQAPSELERRAWA